MSDKSDTPLTDNATRTGTSFTLVALCRQLERALAASQSRCAELERVLMGNLKAVQVGDYVKIRYTTGDRMKGGTIKGKVTEITATHGQVQVNNGWCAHAHDELLAHLPAGTEPCERCDGTGCVDTPFSGSDPSCPECNGEGTRSDALLATGGGKG